MPLSARALPILSDNYAWLLRDEATGRPPSSTRPMRPPASPRSSSDGGRLDMILITHHHDDHIAGVDAVRDRFGAKVVGAAADRRRLPKLDAEVSEGDTVELGESRAEVIDTPGPHDRPHRLFLPARRRADLRRHLVQPGLRPAARGHGCRHVRQPAEAGEAARRHARLLRPRIHPEQCPLRPEHRSATIRRCSAGPRRWTGCAPTGKPTVPSRLADEMAENPFLRAPDAASLGQIRKQKDNFR